MSAQPDNAAWLWLWDRLLLPEEELPEVEEPAIVRGNLRLVKDDDA